MEPGPWKFLFCFVLKTLDSTNLLSMLESNSLLSHNLATSSSISSLSASSHHENKNALLRHSGSDHQVLDWPCVGGISASAFEALMVRTEVVTCR